MKICFFLIIAIFCVHETLSNSLGRLDSINGNLIIESRYVFHFILHRHLIFIQKKNFFRLKRAANSSVDSSEESSKESSEESSSCSEESSEESSSSSEESTEEPPNPDPVPDINNGGDAEYFD